jgi:4-hydroxyacetophenone monooxygenase
MNEKSELLTASDEMIDDVVKYADPMVLRGLVYQLTGDQSIAATKATMADIKHSEASNASKELAIAQSKADLSDPADVAMIQSKAAAFLKAYRDQGAPRIPCGSPERLSRSLSLAAGADIPASELEMWSSSWRSIRGRGHLFGVIHPPRRICRTSSWPSSALVWAV